jgi:hypothetical protein
MSSELPGLIVAELVAGGVEIVVALAIAYLTVRRADKMNRDCPLSDLTASLRRLHQEEIAMLRNLVRQAIRGGISQLRNRVADLQRQCANCRVPAVLQRLTGQIAGLNEAEAILHECDHACETEEGEESGRAGAQPSRTRSTQD